MLTRQVGSLPLAKNAKHSSSYYMKIVPVVRLGWLAPARQLFVTREKGRSYYARIIILLGECNALLASGSDPTCHAGCVKNTYKSLQPT